jgi:hypothetical protein
VTIWECAATAPVNMARRQESRFVRRQLGADRAPILEPPHMVGHLQTLFRRGFDAPLPKGLVFGLAAAGRVVVLANNLLDRLAG